jgi:hypothetical protein
MPGVYTVRLTVDGKKYDQPLTVMMDPRVKTIRKDLAMQYDLSMTCYKNLQICMKAFNELNEKDERIASLRKEFSTYSRTFSSLQNILQDSDMPPTTQTIRAVNEAASGFETTWKKWMHQ